MLADYIVLIMESTALLFMIVLAVESVLDNKSRELKTRLCKLCLLLTILALIIEIESYALDGNTDFAGLTFACDMLSFACGSWIISAFMFYVTAILNEKQPTSYFHAKIVLVLAVLESAVAVYGAFAGKTFTYIDAVYEPGPWIPFLSGFQLVFILYLVIFIIANRKVLGKRDTNVLLIYVFFTVLTTVMEILFEDLPSFYFVGQALAIDIIYVEDRIHLQQDLTREKELNNRIMHQNTLLDGLAREYNTVWLIDREHKMKLFRSKGSNFIDEAVHLFQDNPDYESAMANYIDRFVQADERERVSEAISLENVEKMTPDDGTYVVTYARCIGQDSIDYHQICFAKAIDDSGNVNYLIADRSADEQIRKEKEQQRQLEEAYVMAQSASRAKTTFLNNMSHDIRTPMNAIIGYTGLAASHIDNKSLVQDYLTKIGQSSDHLLSLINDVLDMSRIESGKMYLNESPENLSEILHTLKNIVQADIHSRELEFYIDTVDVVDEDVMCDKLRLNQVLLNVLSNAIKFTPNGGTVSLRIIQKAATESAYASYQFIVKDNGIGMTEDFIQTIFAPFTRMKSSTVSGIQGTGLGMAITKNIIDMMGGNISIDSAEGKGTEVVIDLSFKLARNHKEPERITELEGLRGLVVDDDSSACISVHRMLKDIGMRSEWCTSGKEAVLRTEAAQQEGDLFRVYIIDWLMPDMNGIETTRRIRKVVGDDTPIVILTAYDWSNIEQEAREAGVTAFISKPLFPSDLHCILEKCCGHVSPSEKAPSTESNFGGRKVLLVEDNEMNREIAYEILTEAGFEVDCASDGNIAVDIVRQSLEKNSNEKIDYDLILMDIQMPTMDGHDATRQIRALPYSGKRVPIIAMTANAFAEDRKAALDAGMDDHIAKPISISVLKETLSKFL